MNPLYLKHIALRQFRSFAELDLQLPAQPGVLIIHGSNGLGKSSLFDALEWTLSDRIDHFRDASGVNKQGAYLCRWREGQPGPTSTTLTFSDDSVIERSLLSAKSAKSQLGGNVPDITAFLRAPAWQQSISDLQRYLLLTHFLGQSTLSRLTYRKSNERFDILKEAAQSTAIEAIANALHGQGNNTVVRAYARHIDLLERDVKNLVDLLEQEASLWAEAQSSGAIDEANADIEARRIAEQLARAESHSRNASDTPSVEMAPTMERLQATANRIERECLHAEAQLEDARRLFGEWQRALTDFVEVAASRTSALTRADVLDSEIEQARRLRGERRTAVATHQEAAVGAATAVSRLRTLLDSRALIAKLESEHRENAATVTAATQTKAAAEGALARVERTRQILQRISVEIGQCDEEADNLSESIAIIERAIACEGRIREHLNVLAQLDAANPNIDQAVEHAEESLAAAADSVNAQTTVVVGLRSTVDTMSNAIASIAASLPDDACDCPLCANNFDSASALQARVATAAQRLAPALLAQEETLAILSAARDARSADLQRLQAAQAAIHLARTALAAEREQSERLLVRLDLGSSDDPAKLGAMRTRLAETITALSERRRRRARWQAHPALGAQTSNSEHMRAVRARDAAQRTLNAAARTTADLAAALERAKTDEAIANTAVVAARGNSPHQDDLPLLLQDAEATARQVQEEASTEMRALADADTAVAAFEAEQAGLRARLVELDSRKTDLEQTQRRITDDWLALRQFGSALDLGLVQAVERRIAASRMAVKEAAGQLARLREGRLVWARQLGHRAVLEQIREHVDGQPNATREELLASAKSFRARKEADVASIHQVKEIAKAASTDISAELEEFNSEYIKPLGFLMSRINQAILCDARVGIDLHVKKKKIEQSAVKGEELPRAVGEIDPLLVHSEGQMAALAVSMLCAASLTFPWSRWKALVLDDPLQHNDSIHAAAFADLMSNLVSSEGYQILLSTHDVAQAEFLQRKFHSRRIPCTRLNLLGLGKDGVEWSVQTSSLTPSRKLA